MYLKNDEIKALRSVLTESKYSESARILRSALIKNDNRIQEQRKIIDNMMQIPKDNNLKFI